MAAAPTSKGYDLPQANTLLSQLNPGAGKLDNISDTLAGRCQYISNMVRSSYGPCGLKIMTINRLDRIRVTGDCNNLLKEIILNGPDSKILIDYATMLYEECGDGCKFMIQFAAELMAELNNLTQQGITRQEVLDTYLKIEKELPKVMKEVVVETLPDLSDKKKMVALLDKVISPKMIDYSQKISELVYDSAIGVIYPNNDKSKPYDLSSEFIRVCKIEGGTLDDSYSMPGLFLDGKPSGAVKSAKSCKVAIFSVPFNFNTTEATASVQFKSASELSSFSKDENQQIESLIESMAQKGIQLIISSGKSNDLMLHYANKYQIMVLSVNSKWMIRRLCVALDAKPLVSIHVPSTESLGFIDRAEYKEINEEDFIEFYRKDSPISTIVLFGTTQQLLEMTESAVSSGVNLLKVLTRDQRLIAGGGASEINLAKQIRQLGQKQYGGQIISHVYNAVANSLEKIASNLIENSGITDPGQLISDTMKSHSKGNKNAACVIKDDLSIELVDDITKYDVLDAYYTKQWAMKYAFNAVDQMARVSIIIMAKSSDFNPKPRKDWDNLESDI